MPHFAAAAKKPRKILIYGINYAPEMIGVGRFTGEIGAHLATHGFDVCVVTAPPHYPGWRAARIRRCAMRAKTALASKFCAVRCCCAPICAGFGVS
jgi:hypothetical protein